MNLQRAMRYLIKEASLLAVLALVFNMMGAPIMDAFGGNLLPSLSVVTTAEAHGDGHGHNNPPPSNCGMGDYVGYPYPVDDKAYWINSCDGMPMRIAERRTGLQNTPVYKGEVALAGASGRIFRSSDQAFLGINCSIERVNVDVYILDDARGSQANPPNWQIRPCANSPTITYPSDTGAPSGTSTEGCPVFADYQSGRVDTNTCNLKLTFLVSGLTPSGWTTDYWDGSRTIYGIYGGNRITGSDFTFRLQEGGQPTNPSPSTPPQGNVAWPANQWEAAAAFGGSSDRWESNGQGGWHLREGATVTVYPRGFLGEGFNGGDCFAFTVPIVMQGGTIWNEAGTQQAAESLRSKMRGSCRTVTY